jgi:hypothetical protein
MTPPSELMRSPSNAPLIFLVQRLETRRAESYRRPCQARRWGECAWIGLDIRILRCFNQLRHARQPDQIGVMNKLG